MARLLEYYLPLAADYNDYSPNGRNFGASGTGQSTAANTGRRTGSYLNAGTGCLQAAATFGFSATHTALTCMFWTKLTFSATLSQTFAGFFQDTTGGNWFNYCPANTYNLVCQYRDGINNRTIITTNYFQGYTAVWCFVCFQFDYTNKKFYAYRGFNQEFTLVNNGASLTGTPVPPALSASTHRIGGQASTTNRLTNSNMCEIKVYTGTTAAQGILTSEEIRNEFMQNSGHFIM